MTEKPIAIVLPNWNPNEPRFIVRDCKKCSDDRVFKNNKCVYNQRLGFAYSVEEIVEVLNDDTLEKENEQLKQSHKEILKDLEVTTFDRELLQKENEQLKQQIKELEKAVK